MASSQTVLTLLVQWYKQPLSTCSDCIFLFFYFCLHSHSHLYFIYIYIYIYIPAFVPRVIQVIKRSSHHSR